MSTPKTSRRKYAVNPLDLDWDYKSPAIHCRADAVDARVFELANGIRVLAFSEPEAREIAAMAANKPVAYHTL